MDDLNETIEPRKVIRLWISLVIILVLIIGSITISKIMWYKFAQVESQSHERDWFVAKYQEVQALNVEIESTRTLLTEITAMQNSRWVSRESDRAIYNQTVEKLLGLETRRSDAIREYNTAAATTQPENIAGLTSQINLGK